MFEFLFLKTPRGTMISYDPVIQHSDEILDSEPKGSVKKP